VARLPGSSTAVFAAPLRGVGYLGVPGVVAPVGPGGLMPLVALVRDNDGRALLCEAHTDAKVRTVKSIVRFDYAGPTTLTWTQEKGELKSVDGRWELEDLGNDRTRATYSIEVDLGRMLGMVIRGPLVDLLRDMLAGARAGELKKRIEEQA
jgi:hypothetical protein